MVDEIFWMQYSEWSVVITSWLLALDPPSHRRQMSSRASVEIWHIILKYSISVALFFDTDPLETYGVEVIPRYFYEDEYWESERSRNSLRRVCRAWNEFLKDYDYRFVRLLDVIDGHVPVGSFSKAIRVDVTFLALDWSLGSGGKFTEAWEIALSGAEVGVEMFDAVGVEQ